MALTRLNVESSSNGVTFGNKVTLPETSIAGPALASFGGDLDIAWTGTDGTNRLNVASLGYPPPPAPPLSAVERAIVELTNEERQKAGLSPLAVNAKLVQAAQIHAADMARLNQLEHTLPGALLPTPEDRLRFVGYSYSSWAENIAYNYPDAAAVVAGWMASTKGHRENILNPNFTEIGVGVAWNSRGEPYYCQVFGRPL